jgi:ABC-type Fe3+/spermidine/putrescine transport system ATPase subunit
MAIADKIALMQAGELLQVGAPYEIYHKPNCADVAEFFGSVNWCDGEIVEAGIAASPLGKLRIQCSYKPGEKILLGFRPECLLFGRGAAANGITNTIEARIHSSTFLGDQFVFTAVAGERQLTGKNRTVPAQIDGGVTLCVSPADIMVFPARAAPSIVNA